MVVPTHKPKGVVKIWQNHGMLIWYAHDAHLVMVFKLLADFAGSILETYSLEISANCQ